MEGADGASQRLSAWKLITCDPHKAVGHPLWNGVVLWRPSPPDGTEERWVSDCKCPLCFS